MSESSPEAVVAGQAAAAAVEEVQERQALSEDVTEAVVTSAVAEETAQDAATIAAMAAGEVAEASSNAAMAAGMAGGAAEVAQEALDVSTASVDYAQRAYEEAQATRAEMAEFRQQLLANLTPPTANTDVEEVTVNDNTGGTESTDTTAEEAPDESQSESRPYGRRIRRGRRA